MLVPLRNSCLDITVSSYSEHERFAKREKRKLVYFSEPKNLNRYKNKIERFRTISYCEGLTERQLQKDLALYLFDNHVEFSKEDDTCNGRLDFKLSDDSVHYGSILNCNNKPFIIEIKLFEKVSPALLQKSLNQLIDMILQLNPNVQIVLTTHSLMIFSDGWGDKAIHMEDITINTRK